MAEKQNHEADEEQPSIQQLEESTEPFSADDLYLDIVDPFMDASEEFWRRCLDLNPDLGWS